MKVKKKFLILGYLTLALAFISCSSNEEDSPFESTSANKQETFTFSSNGTSIKGKIFIPKEHETNKNLPAIYLIDFTEQHYQVATDEFDKVIKGAYQVEGLKPLIITLEEHMNIDAAPKDFQEYSDVYKNMASYVDDNYTSNTSRTFIARGSEAGHVLLTLFLEEKETSVFQNFIATDPARSYINEVIRIIENEDFPQSKENKKLHFSFSFADDYYDDNINLINTINEQEYPWLKFESIEYKHLIYENAYPTAFADGIKFVFED